MIGDANERAAWARFSRVLARLSPVGEGALDALARVTETRRFAKGEHLLRGGDRAEWCHFVDVGLVRELYISPDGAEHTRSFIAAGDLTGSLLDLLSGEPAVTFIEALEDTATLAFRYRDFNALAGDFPELHVVARRWAEALYLRKTRREHEMLALPAAARHARWIEAHGALDARVRRRDLASYLGITPEHLSRLRRRG